MTKPIPYAIWPTVDIAGCEYDVGALIVEFTKTILSRIGSCSPETAVHTAHGIVTYFMDHEMLPSIHKRGEKS